VSLSLVDCDAATFPAAINVTRCNQGSCVQSIAAPSGPPDPSGFGQQLYTAQLPLLPPVLSASAAAVALCEANASAALLGQLNATDCRINGGQPGLLCSAVSIIYSEGWTDDCASTSLPDVFVFLDDVSSTFIGFPAPTQTATAVIDGGLLSLCASCPCTSPSPWTPPHCRLHYCAARFGSVPDAWVPLVHMRPAVI